jgi:hypothetical protein
MRQNASLQPPIPSPPMSPIDNVPAVPDDAGLEPIDPATSTKTGSMTYDRDKNSYNLKWESRGEFNEWLTNEQAALGIEIQVSKTWASKSRLYSTCETLSCACNGTGRKHNYIKKTMRERKIDSKRIKGGCPCFIQIKTYPHTSTVLGKYHHDHSHPTGNSAAKII